MSKKCPSCNEELNGNFTFCPNCGKKIEDKGPANPLNQEASKSSDVDTSKLPQKIKGYEPAASADPSQNSSNESSKKEENNPNKTKVSGCAIAFAIVMGTFLLLVILSLFDGGKQILMALMISLCHFFIPKKRL